SVPTIGPDQTVYLSSHDYDADATHVAAIAYDVGSGLAVERWGYDLAGGFIASRLALGTDRVYAGNNGSLYALAMDPSASTRVLFQAQLAATPQSFDPIAGPDGLVRSLLTDGTTTLFAHSPAGELAWSLPFDGYASVAGAVGANGVSYECIGGALV